MNSLERSHISAVIDAAIPFGANRIYSCMYDNPNWIYKKDYNRLDDEELFLEFLTNLLLYDNFVLDDSCMSIGVGDELRPFFDKINYVAGYKIINIMTIGKLQSADPVRVNTSLWLRGLIKNDATLETRIRNLVLPWAYKEGHVDYYRFEEIFKTYNINSEIIPFAIFAYRGLMYASFANLLAKQNHTPTTYIAAPGRIQALGLILQASDVKKFEFVHEGYNQLVNELEFPEKGYDMSFLDTFSSSQFSPLVTELRSMRPVDALAYVIDFRNSDKGEILRSDWARKVLGFGSASSIIGTSYNSIIKDSQITGNVYQIFNSKEREKIMDERKPKLTMDGVKVSESLIQKTDTDADLSMRNSEGKNATQEVVTDSNIIKIGNKIQGSGKWAVIAVVIIVIAYLTFKYVLKS